MILNYITRTELLLLISDVGHLLVTAARGQKTSVANGSKSYMCNRNKVQLESRKEQSGESECDGGVDPGIDWDFGQERNNNCFGNLLLCLRSLWWILAGSLCSIAALWPPRAGTKRVLGSVQQSSPASELSSSKCAFHMVAWCFW